MTRRRPFPSPARQHPKVSRSGTTGRAPRSDAAVANGLPGTLRFMRTLWALVHALERTSKRMTRQVGVTGPQRLVLRVVGLRPHLSAGELASILHVHTH